MTLKQKILSGELALSAKGDTKKVCDAFNYVFEWGVLYGDFARLYSIEKPLQFYFDEKIIFEWIAPFTFSGRFKNIAQIDSFAHRSVVIKQWALSKNDDSKQ